MIWIKRSMGRNLYLDSVVLSQKIDLEVMVSELDCCCPSQIELLVLSVQQICLLHCIPLSAFLDKILRYYTVYQYISIIRAAIFFLQCSGGLLHCVTSRAFSTMFKLLYFLQSDISGRAAMLKAVYYKEIIDSWICLLTIQ